jgi:hypothetical protein
MSKRRIIAPNPNERQTWRIWWTAFAVALLLCIPAKADDVKLWKKVGDWFVVVDGTLGGACFAGRVLSDGLTLRVGLLAASVNAPMYLAIGSPHWQSLVVGSDYEFYLQIDDGVIRRMSSVAQDINGNKFLISRMDEPALVAELMMKNVAAFSYMGSRIARVSLRGSQKAIGELSRCQVANQKGDSHDPFAVPPIDPFAPRQQGARTF